MRQVLAYVGVIGAFALASSITATAHAQDVNAGAAAGASGTAGTSGTATGTAAAPTAGAAAATTPATTTPPAATTTTTVATPTAVATSTTTMPEKKDDDDGETDHEKTVGHLGVTYFGVSQLPIAAAPTGGGGGGLGATRDNVNAPVIGMRYWINHLLGIDAGIGFGLSSGSTTVTRNGADTSVDKPSRTGFAFHVGVPLDLHSGKHYSFELIPEVTTGFASGTIGNLGPGVQDISLSGFRLDAGARVGAEIYFGFMGIPQLALEGSIGLYYRHEQFKVSQGNNGASDSSNTFTTSVNADPWAIFVNNISAIYYF